jgi:RHS repeat-associated protein
VNAVAGRNIYADDIGVDVRARGVVRHAGASWTAGAASWPSGGLAKDVAVYNHFDHLGNLSAQTTAAGALSAAWRHDAFGNLYSGATNTYRHTANHFDAGAGLFYFNNRWYDAALGRFTQRHTPFQPLSEHPYAISEGNPAAWGDASGLIPDVGGALYHVLTGDTASAYASLIKRLLKKPGGASREAAPPALVRPRRVWPSGAVRLAGRGVGARSHRERVEGGG